MGRRKHVSVNTKEAIWNLYVFFQDEAERGRPRHKSIHMKIIKALKTSTATIDRVVREGKTNGGIFNPSLPRKERRRNKYDSFTMSVIRRRVHQFYRERQLPTLRRLHAALLQECPEEMHFSISTLWALLKHMAFRFKKVHDNRDTIMERGDVVASRHSYLRKIRRYRAEGRHVLYVDETWINSNHTRSGRWVDTLNPQKTNKLNPPSGKGKRLIILHAGTAEEGFIPDVELVFTSKKDGDYHNEMNSRHFLEWFEETLLPALQEPSVIILDNASYHNIRVEGTASPTTKNTKPQMQEWLSANGINWESGMLKAELYELVKKHRPAPVYLTDKLAAMYGHVVLRSPVRHCELNAIELIWAQVKGYVAKHNTSFNMKDVEKLYYEAIKKVDQQAWHNAVQHVLKVEQTYWDTDGVIEEFMEPFIIDMDSGSEEEEGFILVSSDEDSDED